MKAGNIVIQIYNDYYQKNKKAPVDGRSNRGYTLGDFEGPPSVPEYILRKLTERKAHICSTLEHDFCHIILRSELLKPVMVSLTSQITGIPKMKMLILEKKRPRIVD